MMRTISFFRSFKFIWKADRGTPGIQVLWFKAYDIEDLDKMCWTFAPYGGLRRSPGPFMASCIGYLFVFVFLVTGISLDHMVDWVRGLGPIMVTCSILL